MITLHILAFLYAFIPLCHGVPSKSHAVKPEITSDSNSKFLLILCDGFHMDLIEKVKAAGYELPAFDMLLETGIRMKYMQNVYPTVTFPNLWSIATGMNVERHGIVHNFFYDPVLNETFRMDNTTYTRFYNNGTEGAGGQPIWETNQLQGHHSVVAVWPGSSAPIDNITATYALPINYTLPWQERVDHIVSNLARDEAAANLGILYFEDPDLTLHHHGCESIEVKEKVVEIDETLMYLLNQLKMAQLLDDINIVQGCEWARVKKEETLSRVIGRGAASRKAAKRARGVRGKSTTNRLCHGSGTTTTTGESTP